MASSEKTKKKSKKGKTLTLTDFLADDGTSGGGSGGAGSTYAPKPVSWADETDDLEGDVSTTWHSTDDDMFRAPAIDRSILPTAPRAAREPNVNRSRLPKNPPYTAFLGNLPYDVSEESIRKFFHGLNISAVRLPRESSNPERLKGFGYAEFDDVDSLMRALSLNEESLGNRRIRVDIADQAQEKERDGGGPGRDRERFRESDKTDSADWRARPTNENTDDYPPRRNDESFGDRYRDKYEADRGQWRDFDRYDGGRERRDRYDDRDRKDRYDDRDRRDFDRGFDSRGPNRRAFGTGFRRDNYDDRRGGDDYRGGDRYGDRSYEDRREDKFDRRNDYGSRDDRKGDFGPRDDYSRREERAPPQRPKLNLKPRSAPKEDDSSQISRASIFGGAKPVDTAAREREVEERLQKEQEKLQRQVDDDKPRGERRPRERHPSWRSEDQQERSRTGSESSQSGGTSTSSTKASRRRENEKSVENDVFNKDDEPISPTSKSPKQEQLPLKVFPAPPPKENAWAKRSSTSGPGGSRGSESDPQSPDSVSPRQFSGPLFKTGVANSEEQTSEKGITRKDENKADGVKDKNIAKSRGGSSSSSSSRSKVDGGYKDHKKDQERRESKKDRDQKSTSEPKKYEETPAPKFSSASKYAALLMDGDEEAEDGTD
ncbi:eukaryotic translation initiation factor 4B isoform X1 [Protopterus annectens]|uniref:eukaryotic translation initiation factor 4B isoform X1 n=1 Tax=Protopterus annectens TaxID=7888 RepID=UPI001CF9AEEC|nr:eukaryotic translation initiation factor 4B isoform X1 [Protopterus annectens]